MLPLASILQSFNGIPYHFNADDIQLHMSSNPHVYGHCLTQVTKETQQLPFFLKYQQD